MYQGNVTLYEHGRPVEGNILLSRNPGTENAARFQENLAIWQADQMMLRICEFMNMRICKISNLFGLGCLQPRLKGRRRGWTASCAPAPLSLHSDRIMVGLSRPRDLTRQVWIREKMQRHLT